MAHPSPLDLAHNYLARGLCVVPVKYKGKKPFHDGNGLTDWPNLRLTANELPAYFNENAQNVGVLLGEASGGLVDVDLDCIEAVTLAPAFLPQTGATFGRASRPRSHWLYYTVLATRKFFDPLIESHKDKAERDKAMLVELRSTGAQTVFPGSIHESGEAIAWEADGDPAQVDASDLERAAAQLAAASVLTRYWPTGSRNDAANALAGGLLRAGWPEDEAARFIEAVCIAAHDEETHSRVRTVVDTAAKLQKSAPVTGWPTLAKIVDKRIVDRVCEWLEIHKDPRAEAHARQWNAPEELPNDLLPVPAFDTRLLPEALREWIADISERMQCPAEFPSVAALVAAATLIGNRVLIRPKRADVWAVVPNLWGACVGKPGMLKTPALLEALKPLEARERLARGEYERAMQNFAFERDFAEARRAELRKRMQKAKDAADKEALRNEYAEADFAAPVERRYKVNDTTVEKLGELLNQNPRGLLLFRDELVGWLKSLEREGREQDRSFYLETWTGSGNYTYDRIVRGTLRINCMTVSILGGIQPGMLMQYLHAALSGGSGDDGLMQRFQLLVYPDAPRTWRNVDRAPDAEATARAHQCFARLDTLEMGTVGAPVDDRGAAFLRFDGQAQDFFDEWRTDLEASLLSGGFEHPALQAHMSKYRSLMPSLALIFHLMDRVNGTAAQEGVSLDTARRAAAWCTFLEAHARRIYGLALSSETTLARSILEHLRHGDLPLEFTARDVYRKQWTGLRKPSDVAEPLCILEDYGWLRSYTIGGKEGGGRRSVCYIAHPMLCEVKAA